MELESQRNLILKTFDLLEKKSHTALLWRRIKFWNVHGSECNIRHKMLLLQSALSFLLYWINRISSSDSCC